MSEYTNDVVIQPKNMDIPDDSHSIRTEGSMIRSSSHGSITYPYRSLMDDNSFPRYHFMAKPGNEAEAFTSSLGMLGHGTPLWNPIGNLDRPKLQLESGISIGDVGFLGIRGQFDAFFNIFHPPESPIHFLCPPDLIPLEPLLDSELSKNEMHFPNETILVSHGIEAAILSSSPLDIKFTVDAREGGILVLPKGASRVDLISTTRIRNYVQKHLLSWYTFLNQALGTAQYPNGTLYVITGTDKAIRWASCLTFPREAQKRRVFNPATIIYRGEQAEEQHYWEEDIHTEDELVWRRARDIDIEEVGACAVFVRGMRFAVSLDDWSRHVLHYKPLDRIPFSVMRKMPALGLRAKVQTFLERRPGYLQKVPPESGMCKRVVFHPLDVLLNLLIRESPSASAAFLEDQVWCAVADKSDATRTNVFRLLVKILETHETFVDGDVVTLLPLTTQSQDQAPATSPSLHHEFPTYIKRQYSNWNRRRTILKRLSKVFPGPGVPKEFLTSIRIDHLY